MSGNAGERKTAGRAMRPGRFEGIPPEARAEKLLQGHVLHHGHGIFPGDAAVDEHADRGAARGHGEHVVRAGLGVARPGGAVDIHLVDLTLAAEVALQRLGFLLRGARARAGAEALRGALGVERGVAALLLGLDERPAVGSLHAVCHRPGP